MERRGAAAERLWSSALTDLLADIVYTCWHEWRALMEPHNPARAGARPNGTTPTMLRDLAICDLAVISELRRIAVDQANGEIGERQHSSNFLGRNRNNSLARIHPTGAPELKEVRCKPRLLKAKIKSRLGAPHCLFEPR